MNTRPSTGDNRTTDTPLCDSMAEGPYPSYVSELARSHYPIAMVEEGLRLNQTQWSSGGYISVPPLLAGIAVRGSSRPEITGDVVSLRLLGVPGGFVSPRLMRALAALSEKYGDGQIRWTSAGSIEFAVRREKLLQAVAEANDAGLDVGSTGDDVRNISACPGTYRCDLALVNAPDLAHAIGNATIDDQQYPGMPNKLKTAVAGCPNDCVRAQMAKDHAFVGVFRDAPAVAHDLMERWIRKDDLTMAPTSEGPCVDLEWLIRKCPGGAIERSGDSIAIDADSCRHCMLCINKCPAIRPGPDRGVAWVVGGKYGHRGPNGPMTGFVLVPFVPAEPPDYAEVIDLYRRFLDVYADYGRRKERAGDMLVRLGLKTVLELMEIEPDPGILEAPAQRAAIVWPVLGRGNGK